MMGQIRAGLCVPENNTAEKGKLMMWEGKKGRGESPESYSLEMGGDSIEGTGRVALPSLDSSSPAASGKASSRCGCWGRGVGGVDVHFPLLRFLVQWEACPWAE